MLSLGFLPQAGHKEVAVPNHLLCLYLSLITCRIEIEALGKCSDLNNTDAICSGSLVGTNYDPDLKKIAFQEGYILCLECILEDLA